MYIMGVIYGIMIESWFIWWSFNKKYYFLENIWQYGLFVRSENISLIISVIKHRVPQSAVPSFLICFFLICFINFPWRAEILLLLIHVKYFRFSLLENKIWHTIAHTLNKIITTIYTPLKKSLWTTTWLFIAVMLYFKIPSC